MVTSEMRLKTFIILIVLEFYSFFFADVTREVVDVEMHKQRVLVKISLSAKLAAWVSL